MKELWGALAATGRAAGSPARVVSLSSWGHTFAKNGVPFDSDSVSRSPSGKGYDRYGTYGVRKLCNILIANEITRRATATAQPIVAFSLHPGMIRTGKDAHRGRLRILFLLSSLVAASGRDAPSGLFGPGLQAAAFKASFYSSTPRRFAIFAPQSSPATTGPRRLSLAA